MGPDFLEQTRREAYTQAEDRWESHDKSEREAWADQDAEREGSCDRADGEADFADPLTYAGDNTLKFVCNFQGQLLQVQLLKVLQFLGEEASDELAAHRLVQRGR